MSSALIRRKRKLDRFAEDYQRKTVIVTRVYRIFTLDSEHYKEAGKL